LPPTSLKGQEDASAKTTFFFQTPNKQSTQVSSSTGLIETGNNNILENPSFEHTTYSTGWTQSGGSPALEQTVVIHGKKAYFNTFSAATASITNDSTLYQSQFSNTQGLASIWAKTSVSGFYLCSRNAGTTNLSNCMPINNSNTWGIYQLPVLLGATSNGLAIVSGTMSNGVVTVGNITGDIYIDDAFVGVQDSIVNVDSSKVAGEAYIPGTANCTGWTRTSTTIGAFATDADCPGPTISYSSMGEWQTTDSDLPRFPVNNMPPGKFKATFFLPHFVGTSNNSPVLAINDGTSTCTATRGNGHNSAQIGQTVSCTFTYTSMGNRSFELYTATASGTSDIPLSQTSPQVVLKFVLEYYGANKAYVASCGANCLDTFSATISSADVVSQESVEFINGNCTNATTGRSDCTFNTGVFSVAPNCTVATNLESTGAVEQITCALTNPATTSGVTVICKQGSTAIDRGWVLQCQKQGADLNTTRTIYGSFKEVATAPGIDKPKTCYYTFGGASATLTSPTECSTGTCVEIYDSCGTASPPTFSSTGVYVDLTWAAGTWANSSHIKCDCTGYDTTTSETRSCDTLWLTGDNNISTTSSGGYVQNFVTTNPAGTVNNAYVQVKCEGQAP
jgi:hypothetical protein